MKTVQAFDRRDITTWPDSEVRLHTSKITGLRWYVEQQLKFWREDLGNTKGKARMEAQKTVDLLQFLFDSMQRNVAEMNAEKRRRSKLAREARAAV